MSKVFDRLKRLCYIPNSQDGYDTDKLMHLVVSECVNAVRAMEVNNANFVVTAIKQHFEDKPDEVLSDAQKQILLIQAANAARRPVTDWNPIDDNAQAFRLAIQLSIRIEQDEDELRSFANDQCVDWDLWGAEAATRLAIVMAAADIGKCLP